MKGSKRIKGTYGYLKAQRKKVVITTVIMLVLSLSIFFIGWWSTGSQKNLLTIVAVLGLLPASRSLVSMIMFLRAKGCSENAHIKIAEHSKELFEAYDLLFTSYKKNYQISHLVVADKVICGFSEDSKLDTKACEKHLETMLKQGGCKNIVIKIYRDIEKYCESLDHLKQKARENEHKDQLDIIWSNLYSISL